MDLSGALQVGERIFEAVENRGFDLPSAVGAFRSEDPQQIAVALEAILQIMGDVGIPYAADARVAIIALAWIVKGYEDGYIRGAEPTDPAMMHASGNQGLGGTPQMHVPLPAGVDPMDPYGFDKR